MLGWVRPPAGIEVSSVFAAVNSAKSLDMLRDSSFLLSWCRCDHHCDGGECTDTFFLNDHGSGPQVRSGIGSQLRLLFGGGFVDAIY